MSALPGPARAGLDAQSDLHVAPATVDDAGAIAQVQVLSWRHAYERLLPAPFLASMDVVQREARWRSMLTAGGPQVLVARHAGQVQGFIAFGPSRDAGAPAQRAEVQAFYFVPDAWSRGWGRQLWLAARAQMQAQGYASVSLWVLAGNARAILFYAAAGFAPEAGSSRALSLGGAQLRELRCVHQLPGSTSQPAHPGT